MIPALSALLERPVWELALGAGSLVVICLLGALIFFWIGFRVAEVSALVGFEGMFSSHDPAAAGNARAIPAEVAARLQSIQDRRRAHEEKASLDELASATGSAKRLPMRAAGDPAEQGLSELDRRL